MTAPASGDPLTRVKTNLSETTAALGKTVKSVLDKQTPDVNVLNEKLQGAQTATNAFNKTKNGLKAENSCKNCCSKLLLIALAVIGIAAIAFTIYGFIAGLSLAITIPLLLVGAGLVAIPVAIAIRSCVKNRDPDSLPQSRHASTTVED